MAEYTGDLLSYAAVAKLHAQESNRTSYLFHVIVDEEHNISRHYLYVKCTESARISRGYKRIVVQLRKLRDFCWLLWSVATKNWKNTHLLN